MQGNSNSLTGKLLRRALLLVCAAFALISCNTIFRDEGNCDVTYKLKFVYDYNMKWADATAHEVFSVKYYVFDNNGALVYTGLENGEKLVANNYVVELPLQPGDYRIVAWCGADNNPGDEHFTIAGGGTVTKESDLTAYMRRIADPVEGSVSNVNLHPLYYGSMNLNLPDYSKEGGEYVYTIHLMKDTNKIKIMLQQMSGENMDVKDFDFRITDANGYLAANNSLVEDVVINYLPWATYNGTAGIETKADAGVITEITVAQAELTVNRLMVDHRNKMFLSVYRKSDGKKIISLPVIDYLLLAKSMEIQESISDQEYLDRQDEYSMLFFLDDGHRWLDSFIYINSWRIVFNNEQVGE